MSTDDVGDSGWALHRARPLACRPLLSLFGAPFSTLALTTRLCSLGPWLAIVGLGLGPFGASFEHKCDRKFDRKCDQMVEAQV